MKEKQCVYITGGSSGIGLALARHYAQEGDDIILLARNQDKLDNAVSDCKAVAVRKGQTIAGISLDCTDFRAIPVNMDRVVEAYGVPDLLILSAGMASNKKFMDMDAEEFDRIMRLNFGGSREMARSMLPLMLKRRSGQIAFISSMAGCMGIYGYAGYCTSKFAVNGFAETLKQELIDTGVYVTLVCPTEVDTPMIEAEAPSALPQTRFLKDLVGTLPPEKAARIIAKGIQGKKTLIITGVRGRLMAWAKRVFPGLVDKSMVLILRYVEKKSRNSNE